jgi:hypothetical protein
LAEPERPAQVGTVGGLIAQRLYLTIFTFGRRE